MAPYDQIPAPDPSLLNEHYLLGEILEHINFDDFEDTFPGVAISELISAINNVRNHNVDREKHLRCLLKTFWHTSVFQKAFAQLDESTRGKMQAFKEEKAQEKVVAASNGRKGEFFLPPSPAVKKHFTHLADNVHKIVENIHKVFLPRCSSQARTTSTSEPTKEPITTVLPVIWEDLSNTQKMEVHISTPFSNWGLTVSNTPLYTFVPRTILGLSNLVKWAKTERLRVRVGGYRHSWSPTFSQDKQILISLLNLEEVTKIPDPISITPEYINPNNELKTIRVLDNAEAITQGISVSGDKGLVRVGVSVTDEQFRRWAVENNEWSFPMDVILVEVTIGGVNGPICHGVGRRHGTMSDLVRAIEYIDANGVLQKVTRPDHLKAAAGSFGLLGIVTHITFAVDPMSYAVLAPTKPPVGLAIPPPGSDITQIPLALRRSWTPAQRLAAEKTFADQVTNSYYAEYFWFTYQQTAWVNCWDAVTESAGYEDYPSPFGTFVQWTEGWLGGVITSTAFFAALPGRWQAQLLATSGMAALPPFTFDEKGSQASLNATKVVKTSMPDALHFRRGIQNMRVRDMEMQIPIPFKLDGLTPDLDIIKKAWWDIINLVYRDSETPMRLTMEMRIMGNSKITMAPQFGNEWGTCSIEVLTVPDTVADGEWQGFCQSVMDIWASYKDERGNLLNIRPHWAKEWDQLVNIRGKPAREYLKQVAYKEAIPEFKKILREIGGEQGWEIEDLQERFSNELWDNIVFDNVSKKE